MDLKYLENSFIVLPWSSEFQKGIICRYFEEISGFEVFSGQNLDIFLFVPNSGYMPEFGTF